MMPKLVPLCEPKQDALSITKYVTPYIFWGCHERQKIFSGIHSPKQVRVYVQGPGSKQMRTGEGSNFPGGRYDNFDVEQQDISQFFFDPDPQGTPKASCEWIFPLFFRLLYTLYPTLCALCPILYTLYPQIPDFSGIHPNFSPVVLGIRRGIPECILGPPGLSGF